MKHCAKAVEYCGSCPDIKNALIMMVDNEAINMEVMQIHLEAEGFNNFIILEQPEKVPAQLKKEQPDILLTALMMREITGLDLLAEIRSDPALQDIPIIVLTASSDTDTKRKALELGVTDLLNKPVDPSELVLRLKNTLMLQHLKRLQQQPSAIIPADFGPHQFQIGSGNDHPAPPLSILPSNPSNHSQPIYSRLSADNPRFRIVIEKFIKRLDEWLVAMQQAWDMGNFEELRSLSHKLRGAGGTVGFDIFTQPAHSLEQLASEQDRSGTEALIAELRLLAERIRPSNDRAEETLAIKE